MKNGILTLSLFVLFFVLAFSNNGNALCSFVLAIGAMLAMLGLCRVGVKGAHSNGNDI